MESVAVSSMLRYLFIYFQTANDGRPRPEIIIGNAKASKIGRHT